LGSFGVDDDGNLIAPEFQVPTEADPGTYVFNISVVGLEMDLQTNFEVLDEEGNEARAMDLDPRSVAPGGTTTITRSHFTPNGEVVFTRASADVGRPIDVGTIPADRDGNLDVDLTMPDVEVGNYTLPTLYEQH